MHGISLHTGAQIDDILVEWKNAPDGLIMCTAPSVHTFVAAISFVEHVLPQMKGELKWAHSVATAWQGSVPIKHTIPMPRFLALVIK